MHPADVTIAHYFNDLLLAKLANSYSIASYHIILASYVHISIIYSYTWL